MERFNRYTKDMTELKVTSIFLSESKIAAEIICTICTHEY